MAEDGYMFSCLPRHASEALLLQAWQQLDQRHRFGIIPRVCRSWHQLSLPTFVFLALSLHRHEAMQQLGVWLGRHGSTLQHLSLRFGRVLEYGSAPWQELANAIQRCTSLVSLCLSDWQGITLPELCSSRKLRSMQLVSDKVSARKIPSQQQFLISLPQELRHLDLHGTPSHWLSASQVQVVFSRLSNLTSLDLRHTGVPLEHLASCPTLVSLKSLALSLPSILESHFQALAKLPCTFLHLMSAREQQVQDFARWSAGQQGRECIERLTGLEWSLYGPYGQNLLWSHAALRCLTAAAGRLRSLRMSGNAAIQDLSLVTGLTQLTSLNVKYSGRPEADVVSALAALPNLQQLTMYCRSAAHADVVRAAAASGQLPSVKDLSFCCFIN